MGAAGNEQFEKIVEAILARQPGLAREELLKKIEQKKARAEGLLNDEGAAFLVASELGVSLLNESLRTAWPLAKLIPNLRGVTAGGRTLAVYPPRQFERQGGAKGKVLKVLVGDRSGTSTFVFWDSWAESSLLLGLKPGDVVWVKNAYTREALRGGVEVHVSQGSEVETFGCGSGRDVDFPPLQAFYLPISEIKDRGKTSTQAEVNVRGVVVASYAAKEFIRAGGEAGRVLRFILRDETGEVMVVAWDEQAERLEELRGGEVVEIFQGRLREGPMGRVEVHLNRSSTVRVGPGPSPELAAETPAPGYGNPKKISAVGLTDRWITVEGTLTDKPLPREVNLKDGSKVKVTTFTLKDETGELRISAWREAAEGLDSLSPGVRVRVENLNAKEGLGGRVEAYTTRQSTIKVLG